MPIIFPFVIQAVLPALSTIFALLVPVLAAVINFTLTRIPKIPSYIRLIKILYCDINSSAKERKIITGGLLVIGSILTFMAYSLIPWTGVPLIGAVTSPIAAAIALVVALVVLDTIFEINKGYYLERLKKENFAGLDEIEADIRNLKRIFGSSWQKVVTTINDASHKIYEEGSKSGISFSDQGYQNYLDHELEGLNVYVAKSSIENYQNLNADLLKQNNSDSWLKDALSFSTSASVGTLAGVGTSAVASSLFVPASIWTTVQGFFGISTGIVVSASTYSLLTLAAPVGLGVLATVGIYSGLMNWSNKEEAAKMSKFLSEIIIAALPMAWIDGELAQQEEDAIDGLITTSGIRQQEQSLVWKAIKERKTFDQIIQTSILFDNEHREKTCSQSNNERLKHRLMLCAAWEIAISDGKIEVSELQLHNRMADKLGISREEVQEIRRVINLKHKGELLQVTEVLQPTGSKTKLLRGVREQYRLRPAPDDL
ncbi:MULTISPECIES: tellurite resistance TerB family protein [Calothrix]|uniref:TerB family tellurite resistance protein n=2 Tax=Calothrix TaxID=1186 RepID=A0ABR8AG71_9CYAN|nr:MULTISPECIES: TerB family tellurite resistance protein [Calothrix]MBD2198510.1 TerB family tellurite resistance protein [Calothrix parietina FACHB-288]MBD2226912.1 TerB family tellurite resistance protein [Calothrix anomala FACHB-343]